MKRSEINAIIKELEATIVGQGLHMPPFCHWTPKEWSAKGLEYDEIRDNRLGWDITDYGLGRYSEVGMALITVRNGNQHQPKYQKPYAEKLLYLREGQHSPMHFHRYKMEDIINRGGGNVVIHVYNANDEDQLCSSPVQVNQDGRTYLVTAGTAITLRPGESITLYPRQYHDFDVEPGTGNVLLGEVSMCNDDETDNVFLEAVGRFPAIEEDEPPYRLLCHEYPKASTAL